mmetsp:Transcript_16319/g.28182  ORF Transcript_16319/g.28182 Transcript_16319/m.28182 type:complete len:308 (-) Transcript_16319:80-1003(-)
MEAAPTSITVPVAKVRLGRVHPGPNRPAPHVRGGGGRGGWIHPGEFGALGLAGLAASVRRRPRRSAKVSEVELPLDSLTEVQGSYGRDLTPEQLDAAQRYFPEVNLQSEGLRLVNEDPPVLLLEGVLSNEECADFMESMRDKDGNFPERLGQANIDVPGWLTPVRTAFRGVPVLDWLGNPTVRWTYKSRCLLDVYLQKVRDKCGLDLSYGQANIKHYRKDQFLPTHIDYNRATLMTYLNDVKDGGHTLFPTLGIKVKPSKGSALVWPNQPPLKHAGDKVLDGEKWIIFYNWPAEQNWEYDDNFEFNA